MADIGAPDEGGDDLVHAAFMRLPLSPARGARP